MAVEKARAALETYYPVIDQIEELMDDSLKQSISLREIFKLECRKFLMLLGKSDGKLSAAEARYMNELFGENIPVEKYETLCQKIGYKEGDSTIPVSLLMVKITTAKHNLNIAESLAELFEMIGTEYISCDGHIDVNEMHTLQGYIRKVRAELLEIENKAREQARREAAQREARRIEAERQAARRQAEINARRYSVQESAPWDNKYYKFPCPYCGRYQVRTADWDDKKLSVAFWGGASDKIAMRYKCDGCRKMWK